MNEYYLNTLRSENLRLKRALNEAKKEIEDLRRWEREARARNLNNCIEQEQKEQ